MKHKILCAFLVAASASAGYAQVKIGTNPGSIDPSSILELEATNKAFYINRVALTGNADLSTVPNPKAGMMVYNTSTVGGPFAVSPGLYYFNGTIWVSTNAVGSVTGLAWLLLGNGGTTEANFLGTVDQQPMNFRVMGQKSGRIEVGNNFSNTAGGGTQYANVAFGYLSQALNTPSASGAGSFNTSVGNYSLNVNTTGRRNTAIGYDVLGANTVGDSNSGLGFGALQVNTTGNNNTGTGAYSLNHNTIGAHNTAVGYQALLSNVSDSGNTSIGAYSSYFNNGGKGNTAGGLSALFYNTTGDSNSVWGAGAGALNTTGSNNTFIGYNANGAATPALPPTGILRWSAAIGSMAFVSVNNGMALGATDLTPVATNSVTGAGPMMSSYVGINVTDPTQRIDFRNGHIRNRQDVLPGILVTGPAGNGVTGATLVAGSSDVRGRILTAGYNNSNGLTNIRVNFQYQATNPPIVTITPANESASTATWFVTSDANGFTLTYRNVYSGSNASAPAAEFNYMVIE